jgi:alpha-beta hydrolase superfamily lysophospholipase
MIEEEITFKSDGLTLSGVIRLPDGMKAGEKRAAFIVLHGFGSHMGSQNVLKPCAALERFGYITLRFDMRGCGKSEGEKGRIICLEQVEDTRNALTFLASHPAVHADSIAIVGTSFGGAVSIYTAGVDERVAAVVSNGGWGNGERKFQGQHPGPAWPKFLDMLQKGKEYRERTGQSLMVPRGEIVPIPQHVKDELSKRSVQMFPPGTINEFPAETAQSMFDFKAEEVIHKIAPRPVLLLHAAVDTVTPTEQSIEMFKRAGQPCELHLLSDVDHFLFAEDKPRVWDTMRNWLDEYFPVAGVGTAQKASATAH